MPHGLSPSKSKKWMESNILNEATTWSWVTFLVSQCDLKHMVRNTSLCTESSDGPTSGRAVKCSMLLAMPIPEGLSARLSKATPNGNILGESTGNFNCRRSAHCLTKNVTQDQVVASLRMLLSIHFFDLDGDKP